MNLDSATLLVACVAIVALSTVTLSVFGMTQRVHRGFWWWTAAQWLLVLGLLLQIVPQHLLAATALSTAAPALATLLLLQWPIVVLAGMRRFSSRNRPGVPSLVDWLLLVAAVTGVLLWDASTNGAATHGRAPAAAAIALNLYAAVLMTRLGGFAASAPMKIMASVQALSAGLQAAWVAYVGTGPAHLGVFDAALLNAGLTVIVSAVVLAQVALLLSTQRTLENLRSKHRKLRHLIDIDGLTRLPNRRRFDELATRALATSKVPSALVLFDVDRLEVINNLLGTATGDEALRQVGHALRETLRGLDVAGRIGGDEFAVLLPQTSIENAMKAAARVTAHLDDRQVAPRIARITLSIGAVQLQPGEALAEGLRRAESALVQGRKQGGVSSNDRPMQIHQSEPSADIAPAI